jgi:Papain-like cysteine protease AvrRpt2
MRARLFQVSNSDRSAVSTRSDAVCEKKKGREMPLPSFLIPSVQVNLVVSPLGGAAANSKKLNLSVKQQQETNWCWAAVSTSVSHFYSPASGWSQCTVANAALPRTDCCGTGASDPLRCNRPWYLDMALNVTDNLDRVESRSLTFGEVQAEIARDAAVGTRVGWFGGGGHFQTIVGWLVADSGVEYIDVSDPIYLDSQVAFSSFASGYQSGGDWTHSYLTQRPPPAVAVVGGAAPEFEVADLNALGA